jgi:hypothetical protein
MASRLFESGEGSDFKIICGNCSWNVHASILSMHSDILAKACYGPFLGGVNRTVNLSDDEEDCVQAMLEYFYQSEYSEKNDSLLFHLKMMVIANIYNVSHLKKYAAERFDCKLAIGSGGSSVCEAATFAFEHESVPDEIRQTFVTIAIQPGNEDLCDELIESHADLGCGIARVLNSRRKGKKVNFGMDDICIRCVNCGRQMFCHGDNEYAYCLECECCFLVNED